jgi:hypothetical protein
MSEVNTAKRKIARKTPKTANKIIRWTNKFSGEQGFVRKINHKDGYFENTFDKSEAMPFAVTDKLLATLEEYCHDNTYEALEA